jgi:hypothetical protein
MLTARHPDCRMAAHVREDERRQTITCGGSRLSEQKALTVAARGPSGEVAVTTVTPVAYSPHRSRNTAGSGGTVVDARCILTVLTGLWWCLLSIAQYASRVQ